MYKKKKLECVKCSILFLIICLIMQTVPCEANTPLKEKFAIQGNPHSYEINLNDGEATYAEVLTSYTLNENDNRVAEPILSLDAFPSLPGGIQPAMENNFLSYEGKVFKWENNEEWTEWCFQIDHEGLYEIEVDYCSGPRGDDAVRTLEVDGKVPFREANKISFHGIWKDRTEDAIYNRVGDEIRPKQIPVLKWRTVRLTDSTGFYSEPFKFYFSTGTHSIRLNYVSGSMYVGAVRLVVPEKISTYQEVVGKYEAEGYKPAKENQIKIQAESPVYEKSHPTIRREVSSDPNCEPRSLKYVKLNIIGDWMWRNGNQSVTWQFEVPEDGLYKIGLRCLQHWGSGLPVYRQFLIDGKVPFKEMLEYRIPFSRNWRLEVLKDEKGQPYEFFLEKGVHTLTSTVKIGDLTDVIHSINEDSQTLSRLLLEISMITGSNPDPNYEYELEKRIPGLTDVFMKLQDSLKMKIEILERITDQKPAIVNSFLQIIDDLQMMIQNPNIIPRRFNDLQSIQSGFSNWYISLQDQPLAVDYILYGNPEAQWMNKKSNIFQMIAGIFQNLFYSFIKDYDNVDGYNEAENQEAVIKVWVGRGKEWAETLKRLAEEKFTPETGIRIKMNVLPSTQLNAGSVNALMLAAASRNAPDAALCVSTNTPVEFAIRDAVVDLTQFDDFDECKKAFLPGILEPFKYNGGVFGLPETMDFRVLFYRKDVLKKLGIVLPDTWEDVYSHVLPVLYQNNMQMYLPPEYTTFLYQLGGSYYTGDGKSSALDTPEAFRAFKEYVETYTNYGAPVFADFYNRMRTGEMPMGIAGFQHYMTMTVAAPELAGKWGIAPVPGHKRPDGTIDRSTGGTAVDADMIMSQSKYKDECWKFIKWWLDAETQVEFARDVEAMIGTSAKWNPANMNAYSELPWDERDLGVIRQQWQWAKDIPNVLGGYFTARHINNAWNRVVLGTMSARDSLEIAVESINKELKAKQEEYSKK